MKDFNYMAFAMPSFFVFLYLEYWLAAKQGRSSLFKYEGSISNLTVKSYSFLWQHFHYYLEIIEACKRQDKWKDKIGILFGGPSGMDQTIRPVLEQRYFQRRSLRGSGLRFRAYLNAQILLSVILLFLVTGFYHHLDAADLSFAAVFLVLTLINCGALLEQRQYIFYLECFRLIVFISACCYQLGIVSYTVFPVLGLIVLERLFSLKEVYNRYVNL